MVGALHDWQIDLRKMRKILVVDDNVELAENIAEIVADAGVAEAIVADSGVRALGFLRSGQFDAMVTDMRMPGMNGAELIHQARRIDPGLPVVVMSAYSGDEQLTTASYEGVFVVLAKPVPIDRILEAIAKARRGRMAAIVEDDRALADNLAEAMRERGFTTMTAHSMAEAELLRGAPCVALVDVRVPGGQDGAALTCVAAKYPDVPMLVVTAFRDRTPLLPGIAAVFEKPFDTKQLLDAVEKACAQDPAAAVRGQARPRTSGHL
jgi:DNA-binding NtrC family response regulator